MESQLSTFHAKSRRTEEVLFGTKHSSKQKNSLNPKPTRSLADFLCILLHPGSTYNICAHSTTRYGYLTRNYLTLKGNVLVSEYGSLQLLTEKFYFSAKAPLECQKEMERTHFTISGPPPVKEAHLEVARSTREHNADPDPISKWQLEWRQPVKPLWPVGECPLPPTALTSPRPSTMVVVTQLYCWVLVNWARSRRELAW